MSYYDCILYFLHLFLKLPKWESLQGYRDLILEDLAEGVFQSFF